MNKSSNNVLRMVLWIGKRKQQKMFQYTRSGSLPHFSKRLQIISLVDKSSHCWRTSSGTLQTPLTFGVINRRSLLSKADFDNATGGNTTGASGSSCSSCSIAACSNCSDRSRFSLMAHGKPCLSCTLRIPKSKQSFSKRQVPKLKRLWLNHSMFHFRLRAQVTLGNPLVGLGTL